MPPIISVETLSKTYASGLQALKGVDLDIRRGEIFALLGPNGAGKSTLINIVCGLVNPSGGTILVDGHDAIGAPRAARSIIGLVPQEPAVAVTMPQMMPISVVLPAPLGPSRAKISPCSIARSMPRRA